jgi:hypothetical protein
MDNGSGSATMKGPLHAASEHQRQPQCNPVEVELRQAPLGSELGAAIGIGRLRREVFGEHALGSWPGLRAHGGEKDESFHTGAPGGSRKLNRRLGVEHTIIIFRQSGHRVGDPCRVNDGIYSRKGSCHVLRPGEITDDGARRLDRHLAGSAQENTQPHAVPRQLAQQMLTDEPRGAGEGNERVRRCPG